MSIDHLAEALDRRSALDRWLNWKVILPVVVLILLVSAPFAIRLYQLSSVPITAEPFDLESLCALEIDPRENAVNPYREALLAFGPLSGIETKIQEVLERGFDDETEVVRQFLLSKQDALALWRTGVARPHFEAVPPRDLNFSSLLEHVQRTRSLARIALAESRRLASEGELAAAWSLMLDTYRMGQQLGPRGALIERLVGIAIKAMSMEQMVRWSEDPAVDETLLAQALREFALAKERTPRASSTYQVEYIALRNSLSHPELLTSVMHGSVHPSTPYWKIDWMTRGLYVFGEPELSQRLVRLVFANILSQCDRPFHLQTTRTARYNLYEPDPAATAIPAPATPAMARSPLTVTAAEIERLLERSVMARMLVPAMSAFHTALGREECRSRNLVLALALQRYHRRKGTFPPALTELVEQKMIDEIPIDPFADPYPQPLSYQLDPDCVWTWSVGPGKAQKPGVTTHGEPGNCVFRIYAPGERPSPPRPPAASAPVPAPSATEPASPASN